MSRDPNNLPAKFTDDERDAYRDLYDHGCTGWSVDLKTKQVHFVITDGIVGTANSLVVLLHYYKSGQWSGNLESRRRATRFDTVVARLSGIHHRAAASHPALASGVVHCTTCKRRQVVDSAACLRSGWPKCCGYTMRLGEASDAT